MALYNRQYSDQIGYEDQGPASRLVRSLIGIQERKRLQAIQDEHLRMQQEEARQQAEQRQLEHEQTLAKIAAQAEMMKAAPEKKPEAGPEEVAYMQGLPPGVDTSNMDAAGRALVDTPPDTGFQAPEPMKTLKVGGIEVPIPSRAQSQEMADEDFRRKLEQLRQLEVAKGGTELTPEMIAQMPESIRPFMHPNQIMQPLHPESVLAAEARGQNVRPENPEPVIIDGKPTLATPTEIAKAKSEGRSVVPYSHPREGGSAPALKPYTDKRTGEVVFLDNTAAAQAQKEGWLAPGPTSEMRNTAYQAGAVEPAFELVQNSLDNLEREQQGVGHLTQMIPGTQASYALSRFRDQAKALLGAIVARQAGEGSRLSDEDRKVYARAATLVDNMLMLPGGVQEARARLKEARDLMNVVQQRRAISGAGAGAPPTTPTAPTQPKPTHVYVPGKGIVPVGAQ